MGLATIDFDSKQTESIPQFRIISRIRHKSKPKLYIVARGDAVRRQHPSAHHQINNARVILLSRSRCLQWLAHTICGQHFIGDNFNNRLKSENIYL